MYFCCTVYKFYKKFELMLIKRARVYSSSCSQVVLVCLHLFIHLFVAIHFSAAKNRNKITKNLHFGDLRSFKVIDVDITKMSSVLGNI